MKLKNVHWRIARRNLEDQSHLCEQIKFNNPEKLWAASGVGTCIRSDIHIEI